MKVAQHWKGLKSMHIVWQLRTKLIIENSAILEKIVRSDCLTLLEQLDYHSNDYSKNIA